MATNTLLVGVASFSVDGSLYSVKDAISYRPSTVTRETLTSQTGELWRKEMPTYGEIKATFYAAGNVSVDSFNAITDSTVVILAANGVTVTGSNMWSVETQTADLTEGTFEVTFQGTVTSTVAS